MIHLWHKLAFPIQGHFEGTFPFLFLIALGISYPAEDTKQRLPTWWRSFKKTDPDVILLNAHGRC